jgi:Fe-S-cluster containining protein
VPTDLESRDAALLAGVDAALSEGARHAGELLDFGRGCPSCCYGPFPINALDAARLRRGLARLEEDDPGRAQAVRTRAAATVQLFAPDFPGDPASGRLDEPEAPEAEAFFTRHVDVPCPALDLATGRCDLYYFRPLTCRNYGLPVRLGEEILPPCQTCFNGSRPEAEACRVVVDEPDDEGILLDLLGDSGETVIAFTLNDWGCGGAGEPPRLE